MFKIQDAPLLLQDRSRSNLGHSSIRIGAYHGLLRDVHYNIAVSRILRKTRCKATGTLILGTRELEV